MVQETQKDFPTVPFEFWNTPKPCLKLTGLQSPLMILPQKYADTAKTKLWDLVIF